MLENADLVTCMSRINIIGLLIPPETKLVGGVV